MQRHLDVKVFLENFGLKVVEYPDETPTVETAAAAVGCSPAEIAKSVLLLVGGRPLVVVAAGDRKVNSSLLKKAAGFSGKVRLPSAEQVEQLTGYPAGGVCPFLLPEGIPVFLDLSLERFSVVYPAAGTRHSAVPVPAHHLEELTGGNWVNVTVPLNN